METYSSSFFPTPLAHADNPEEGQPRGRRPYNSSTYTYGYEFVLQTNHSCASVDKRKIQLRLQRPREHRYWTMDKWNRVNCVHNYEFSFIISMVVPMCDIF
ncbi:hypothetical protein TNCV_1515641 [Trichonephila clavipes]|nr:hypothetical protein TNCV_1515641 [Trichonephila clavipes]